MGSGINTGVLGRGLSRNFHNSDEAYCRLDSIAFCALEGGVEQRLVQHHLRVLADICLYFNQSSQDALEILEHTYCVGIRDKDSRLRLWIDNPSRNFDSESLTDPVNHLYRRVFEFEGRWRQGFPLSSLRVAATQEFIKKYSLSPV